MTEFSLFMTVIWTGSAIILYYFFLRKRKFVKRFGAFFLVILYLICAFRLLVPVELPFTRIFEFHGKAADIYHKIFLEYQSFFGYTFKIADIILGIWICGICITMTAWIFRYVRTIRKLYRFSVCTDIQTELIMTRIQQSCVKKIPVKIRKCPVITIPLGIGIVQKTILIPEYNYTQEEMYYILLHEYTHFINRDIEIKAFLQIFRCIYWWNPCVYLLQKEIEQALEIKCDLTVTKAMDKRKKISYLTTLLSVLKKAKKKQPLSSDIPLNTLLKYEKEIPIKERFEIVTDTCVQPVRSIMLQIILSALLCLWISFSYMFQFQPEFQPVEKELPAAMEMTPENSYLIDYGTHYELVGFDGEENATRITEKEIADDLIMQGFEVKEKN